MLPRSPRTPRARHTALLVWAAVAVLAAPVRTATDAPGLRAEEAQVKAAFLFNFAKFTSWPAPADGPLVIGIAGDHAFVDVVERVIRGRTVNGRELVARRHDDADEQVRCHVLFVTASDRRDISGWLSRVHGPVLTVGENPEFLRDGGMVRLYVENSRVRFQISQKNAEAAGLKISSQLLMLAAR
jgi:hypothetical protein